MTSRCCSSEKAVLVVVYAERPRRKRRPLLGDNRQRSHHLPQNEGKVRGQNRKAELLDYAKHLRASTQSASASLPSQPLSDQNKQVAKIWSADRKQKHSSHDPACLDKWECLLPSFLRSTTAKDNKGKKNHNKSVSTVDKMKALVKSLHVQKKGNFLSKLLTTLKKRR